MTQARIVVVGLIILASLTTPMRAHAQRSSRAGSRVVPTYAVDTNDELQPATLPPLPLGMTIDKIVDGDRLFHARAGCFACHGAEAQGLPSAGDGITSALFYARHEWKSLDSLITVGIPDVLTRSPIAMPARGARGDLTATEINHLAAYVWAISAAKGEPWPGGHASHGGMVPWGSTKGTAPIKPVHPNGIAAPRAITP